MSANTEIYQDYQRCLQAIKDECPRRNDGVQGITHINTFFHAQDVHGKLYCFLTSRGCAEMKEIAPVASPAQVALMDVHQTMVSMGRQR